MQLEFDIFTQVCTNTEYIYYMLYMFYNICLCLIIDMF